MLFELIQTSIKVVFLLGCIAIFIKNHIPFYMILVKKDSHIALSEVGDHIHQFVFLLVGCLFCIAAIDLPYKMYKYYKSLRMTKEEVKKEYKETEGSPEMRSRIRSLQRQQAKKRMMSKVKTSDVVVTNPTHYAVALKYTDGQDKAPKVVAKGVDAVAERIKLLAEEHDIPIIESPVLARSLNKYVDLDAEIPGSLYAAVAKVLAYVYALKKTGEQKTYQENREDVPDHMYIPE